MAQLPLSRDVLTEQLSFAKKIIEKWEQVDLPGMDSPGTDDHLAEVVRQMAGELILVARQCEALATIVLGDG